VGEAQDLTLSNSYFAGQVLGTNGASAGGIIGDADRNTVIENSYVTGLVEAEGYAGALAAEVSDSSVTITDSAWDTDTTGQSDAIGYTPSFYTPTVTNTGGLTTSDMQGTLTLGGFTLDSSTWGTGSGLYPYFNWEHSSTPEAVTGTVYSDAGTTTQSGATVSALSGGNLIGSAASGANGYYYILTSAGSLDAAGVLSYLDGESTKAATFSDNVTATGISGADIHGNTLRVDTAQTSLSDTLTGMAAALGSSSDTDLDFLSAGPSLSTISGYDLTIEASTHYTVDGDVASGGALSVSSSGALTADGTMAWADGEALSLTASGDIALNSAIDAANGTLDLSSTGTITTGAAGAVNVDTFNLTSGDWSQTSSSLPDFYARDFSIDGGQFLRALGGNGSSGSPYRITDVYGLQGLGSSDLVDRSFQLANDIDASGTADWNSGEGFDPIGVYGTEFSGSLDGQGYTISGLTIDRGTENYVGLFGETSSGASISDLVLSGGSVTGDGAVGALVGAGTVVIENVHVSTDVIGSGNGVGGLAGNLFSASITGSSATGTVTGAGSVSTVGGLVGSIDNASTIHRSYATGNVTVGGALNVNFNTGGLVGENLGSITESFATGNVVTGGNAAGGLVGYNEGSIADAYATGAVSAAAYAGGLIGEQSGFGSVTHAYARGSAAAGDGNQGGVVGLASTGAGSSFVGVIWDKQASGLTNAYGYSYDATVSGLTGVTRSQMMQLDTFVDAGFSIDDQGGTANTWRIYEGHTAPLLRGFLTAVTVTGDDKTKTYDGLVYSGGFTYSLSDSGATLLGVFGGGDAVSATAVGSHAIDSEFYSDQFGYDIVNMPGILTITEAVADTPGSPDPSPQILERNRLAGPEALELNPDGSDVCEPGVIGGEDSVHPCNSSFGTWLSVAAE
jgi:hypothetical protein